VEKTFQTAAGTFSHSGIFLPYVEEESVIQKFPHDEFFSLGYLAPAAKLALKGVICPSISHSFDYLQT